MKPSDLAAALSARRQLKVTVPARLLVGLHARKLLDGEEMSVAVERALREYLAAEA